MFTIKMNGIVTMYLNIVSHNHYSLYEPKRAPLRKLFVNTQFTLLECIKGEASTSILCRLSEWKMILEIKQQKFGQIWIIQSRAMVFQSSG